MDVRSICLGLVCCLALHSQAADDGFQVRLGLTCSHLRELFFGCANGASPGFDTGLDDFAPPPGIQTGYTAFVPEDRLLPPLYKDIRAPAEQITWRLQADVWKSKSVGITWDPSSLPARYDFRLASRDKQIDMRKETRLELATTETLTITVTRRPAVADARAQP